MADNDRETYIAWLREEVKKHCNSEGRYEAYWDYRDSITPDQIASAVENFEKEGYASPLSYLETKLLDDMGSDLEDVFYVEGLLTDLRSAGDEVNRGWDNAQSIWDDLDSVGYKGIELNLDQLLGQSEFHVNVFFATEKEQDADMGSIVSVFGNDYRDADVELLDADDLDNALSYLVNQQGHSVAEVYGVTDSPFIHSVREENANNSSEAMSELVALVCMDGHQMLDFIEKTDEAKSSLVLPKDDATIGIFNQWSGCGGMLDIQLEKDAVLPLSMVRQFQIEGQSNPCGYTVNDVYGLVGSAWRPARTCEGIETDVKEDYALALDKIRDVKGIAAREDEPPVSLKATAKECHEASTALVGDGAHEDISRER